MASNDVVLQTVKKMMASGVDDETVRMTLRGISLSDDEINGVMEEARGTTKGGRAQAGGAAFGANRNSMEEKEEGPEGEGEEGGGGDAGEEDTDGEEGEEGADDFGGGDGSDDALHGHIESASQEQLAHHSETHQMLEGHADRLEAARRDIGSLHEKFDSLPRLPNEAIATISALDRRISSLEKAVAEAGAGTLALKGLMQKIMDSERQILLELQKRK